MVELGFELGSYDARVCVLNHYEISGCVYKHLISGHISGLCFDLPLHGLTST